MLCALTVFKETSKLFDDMHCILRLNALKLLKFSAYHYCIIIYFPGNINICQRQLVWSIFVHVIFVVATFVIFSKSAIRFWKNINLK